MHWQNRRKAQLQILTATATAVSALCGAGAAVAQVATSEQTAAGSLERVVVTARKQEEDLIDVPISVAVVSGINLEAGGIQQLGEALQTLPAVSVTPTSVGDLMFIRGIGSGENQGFEMSVGTFIDGVYYGRGRSSRHAFLDVDRIEVLKGPQPILFGKNTIGGALNITTRKPTNSLEVSIDEYIEPEFNTFRTTGVVSGPLTDTLAGRFVVRHYASDGYVENPFLGSDAPSRDDWVARGVLVWDPIDQLEVTLKGEYGEADMVGGRAQISKASSTLQALILPIDPDAEFTLNHVKSGPGVSPPFNREFENNATYNGTLTAVLDLGAHELTSVSSYVGYDVDYAFDSDFTPLDMIHQNWDQHWHSWSQEVRLASSTNETFEYQVGAYLASEELKSYKLAALNFAQTPLPFGAGTRVQNFRQDTDNWSLFAEGTFNATDALAFVVGYRYTDDEKTMDKTFHWADANSVVPNPNLTIFTAIGLGTPHAYSGIERNTNNDSIALTVRYRPDDIMYYASYTQGFKAGGFDEGDSKGILSNIIFDDESVNSYEVGLKAEGMGGRLRTQAAAFYSEYDDLQVSIFDGVASLIVGNAAAATSRGVEFQGELAATDRLTLGLNAAYLDAEYDSYRAGPCPFGQGATCDLTGKSLPYAPDFSGSLNARWDDQFANGWGYTIEGNLFHTSSFFTAGDLDPFVAQDAFTKLDASITLSSPGDAWSFSLVGKNLTDETTAHFGDDIPLSNILGNNYEQYVDPPRTIAVQARFRFR